MNKFEKLLSGGDLRSIGKSNRVSVAIRNQQDFDELFYLLIDSDRLLRMRAADAVEKITITHPEYLKSHKKELFSFFQTHQNIEFQWHLALLITRLDLSAGETNLVWRHLSKWAMDEKQSKIVRVNAIQSLFDISSHTPSYKNQFSKLANELDRQNVPSISARLRKLMKLF